MTNLKNYKLSFLCLILMAFSTLTIISCDSDDSPTVNPDNKNKKEAVVAVLRKSTPSGRIYYMGAFEKVPSKLESDGMIDVGGFVAPYTFENHPYTWNATDGTFTRYDVDPATLKLKKGGSISLTSYGIQSGSVMPAFISSEKAYLISLVKGLVFKFNPKTMKITKTINVSPLPGANDPKIKTNTYESYLTSEGKVLMPITSETDDFNSIPAYAMMGVFDINSETVKYVKDNRMMMGYYRFTENEDGTLYYRPAKNTVHAKEYADSNVSKNFPTSGGLIKVNPDGTFSSDFIDVDKILQKDLGGFYTTSVVYAYGDYALVQYLNESYQKPEDPSSWWKLKSNEYALVNLKEKSAVKYNPFGDLGTLFYVGKVNKVPYYGNFGAKDKKYSMIKQTGVKNFEVEGESVGGVFLYIGKIEL